MPYCSQCGTQVRNSDVYCASCGARQPQSSAGADVFAGISGKTASLLCYVPVLGWIAAIVVLASNRFRHDARVRFHGFQGLYLFVAWLIVSWVIDPLFHFPVVPGTEIHRAIPGLLKAILIVAWIFMMIKVSRDENYELPILGELAHKSVAEQR